MEQTLWHKSLLEKSEHDIRLAAFRERFGVQPEYWHLALYAAFPPALTFDLLAKIAQNFPLPTSSFKSQIVVLTPDVLMSPLCEPLGHGMYEMYSAPRKILLNELRNVQPQDEDIFRQLGFFLDQYRRECLAHIPTPALEEAFRFVALAHTDALKAATEYLNAYEAKKTGARIMRRLAAGVPAAIEANRAPGHPLAVAMELTRGIDLFEAGEVEEGAEVLEHMSDYIDMKAPKEIVGIRAQVPAPVWSFLKEHAAWRHAVWLNTAEAYSRYLDEYPEGRYAAQAEEQIADWLIELQETAKDDEAWKHTLEQWSLEAFKAYLKAFPKGQNVAQAQKHLTSLQKERQEQKGALLQDIKEQGHQYTAFAIRELIDKDLLSKQNLVEAGIISAEALELLLSPPDIFQTLNWSDLPPLRQPATDVYFFGIPSSGKSCLLSGILYHADKVGALELEIDNNTGQKYAHSLMRAVEIGYVPPASPTGHVNYIAANLYDEHEKPHPINFIEMSGEFFETTYQKGNLNEDGTIGAKGYLANMNRKIIFLVIDYKEDNFFKRVDKKHSQVLQLMTAMSLLENDGTLKKTDAVYLVLTKSDLLPGGASNYAVAEAFIDTNYATLREKIRRISRQYKLNSAIHTFSLGKFSLEKTFAYDAKMSKLLLEEILNSSFSTMLKSPKKKL